MTEFARGPDGEYAIRLPGRDWQQVDAETYAEAEGQAGQSRLGRAARAFGDEAVDAAGFMVDLMTPHSLSGPQMARGETPLGQRIMQSNDERQRMRRDLDPGMADLGVAAGLALPGVPLGGPAGRVGARVAGPGLARGAEIGQRVVSTVAERTPVGRVVSDIRQGMARSAERQSLSAAAVSDDALGRMRRDLMTPDELRDFKAGPDFVPLQSQQVGLTATNRLDYDMANKVTKEIELRERSDPSLVERMVAGDRESLEGVRLSAQESLDRTFLREIGSDAEVVTKGSVGDRMTEIGAELNAIQDKAGPIRAEGLVDEIEAAAERGFASAEARYKIDQIKALVEAKTDDAGLIAPKDHGVIRNRVTAALDQAAKSGSDTEVADMLEEVRDRLMARVSATLDEADVARDLELRRQWKLSRAAVDRETAISKTGSGLNVMTYNNALGQKDRMFKTGRSQGEFERFLRTIEYLQAGKMPSSGTAEGLARASSGGSDGLLPGMLLGGGLF